MTGGTDDPPPTSAGAASGSKPGGLLGYLINRKKSEHALPRPASAENAGSVENAPDKGAASRRGSMMKYHDMVNAGGSFYFGSMGALIDDSDSDDDKDSPRRGVFQGAKPAASLDATQGPGAASDSWLAAFQRSGRASSLSVGEVTEPSLSSSSWMSQAWRTVDSAKEWVMATSSGGDAPSSSNDQKSEGLSSYLAVPPSLSTAMSKTLSSVASMNPFSDSDHSASDSHSQKEDAAALLPTSAFLPNFASRFEWATRRRNPYQAVIGRGDTDYLLSPSAAGWNWFSLTSWLPWITSRPAIEGGGVGDGDGDAEGGRPMKDMLRQAMGRKKSLPSEASVLAVKNLLSLVQQQMALEVENSNHASADESVPVLPSTEENDGEQQEHELEPRLSPSTPTRSINPAPRSPALMPISTPREAAALPSFPDLKGDETFDSEASGNPSLQASPARGSPSSMHGHCSSPRAEEAALFSPVSSRPVRATFVHGESSGGSGDLNGSSTSEGNGSMHAEMAARLAEGTLRAYRDLALDEATELHSALHHWTIRWERPFLGWLEAGPSVWFSEGGYSPYLAGKKVSQIQAVLARRCAVIGEIQQHLWRANWQKGVAEWGMLGGGVGAEWTSVVGEFGGMDAGGGAAPSSAKQSRHGKQKLMKIFHHSTYVGTNVSNSPGGSIVVDEDALTTWSIDAIRVIRDQLYRALPTSHSAKELPYVEHWPRERRHFRGEEDGDVPGSSTDVDLPRWAEKAPLTVDMKLSDASRAAAEAAGGQSRGSQSLVVSDLQEMSNEVQALLQSIEVHLEQQRARRLDRLRPPSHLRRNWYLVAAGVPASCYLLYKLTKEHGGLFLMKTLVTKIGEIYRDHVAEPLNSIYQELFTKSGRIDVTDRKARIDAIESLKRMLRSWLEESFPNMSVEEQIERAETMDISLIEEKMEESIKHLYELNSVVRMSLIEMQFIKKELLSALVAMDELMGSNEINMRIAAMTPAFILLVAIRRTFRLLFYAFFKVGKSKEEIYSSFRQTILDIERLLVMRDNPPMPPDRLEWGSVRASDSSRGYANTQNQDQKSQTLSAEDLGMLLLHIHECRTILWQSRRRFGSDILRNVSEDLAELAGERGPVSVSQQLQIISRMARTYPFMKVVSSGVPFDMIIPG